MKSGPYTAYVPFGDLDGVKSRLAPALSLEARQDLALTMLGNVLDAVSAVQAMTPAVVVTPDRKVADFAAARGARVFACAGISLNTDLAAAIAAMWAPGSGAAVLMADLPRLDAGALAQAIASVPEEGVLIASDQTELGTSLLAWNGLDEMPSLHFGADSFALHCSALANAPSLVKLVRDPAFNDIDQSDDLHLLPQARSQGMVSAL
ncbi:MAG: 2-phospho-L-lactate guanylyltransferase [Novosphingobium sp.]